MDLQYDKHTATDLSQIQNPMKGSHVGPSQWGQQPMVNYNAKSYQDTSQCSVVSNKLNSDSVARKLDMDFQNIGKSRDASPTSTTSSGRPVGNIDLDFTIASKESENSSFSSIGDKRPIMYRRLASTDLDVSLEHERKGKGRGYRTDDRSPMSDKDDYQRSKQKDKYLAYKLSKSTPDLQKLGLGQDDGSYTGLNPSLGGSGDREAMRTEIGRQTASSLCKSNPALQTKSPKECRAKKGSDLPLNAKRLRAIKQKTRNAVINIMDGGEVCLEFLKSKDGKEKVVEVFRISPDGQKVNLKISKDLVSYLNYTCIYKGHELYFSH